MDSEYAIRPDLLIFFWNWGKKYIQVQHKDFTINFILSFFLYLNLGEKVADFSERSSQFFSSAVGAYWKHWLRMKKIDMDNKQRNWKI